jgi:HAD superfamily hydrolase (TIGR01662 family)
VSRTAAVFFDVDFTLIHPGPRFQGSGYRQSCARHGLVVDELLFDAAVAGAGSALETTDHLYDADVFINYTRRIIELMGGADTSAVEAVAREMYEDWASHHHFSVYEDVRDCLEALDRDGVRLGLISNSHRCLASFQSHFGLDSLFSVAVSSAVHGYMKPHPTIFRAALAHMQVEAAEALMVGDSLTHDVLGARQIGMDAVWLARGSMPHGRDDDVRVIASLRELPALVLSPAAS